MRIGCSCIKRAGGHFTSRSPVEKININVLEEEMCEIEKGKKSSNSRVKTDNL